MKRIILLGLCVFCVLLGACEREEYPEGKEETSVQMSVPTTVPTETPTPVPTEAPVELTIYSQVSGFWGEQQGWFAKVMLDKFNVKLQILPDIPEESELEQADIIVFGGVGSSTGNLYRAAAEQGKLLDWEENNLLEEHGSYILEHMTKALEYNRSLTPDIGKVFGFGHGVATDVNSVEEFIYTWDIRWDLYKQLGYPEIRNLEDLTALFEQMKEQCPLDEMGEATYAMSLWSDWDETMVFGVKSMASAYYGLDELGLGLYDTTTGKFYGALQENGPYLELLKFFNTLYRRNLLDPASATQTYEDMLNKMQSGGVLFSMFNYAGSIHYNTEEHLAANKYMASLLPEEALPLAYGMSVYGGRRVWSISADTKYPELCMDIINWLCTPEGVMVSSYGPQGLIWDYDAEGNTYFTEFGKQCQEDGTTRMTGEYAGLSYWDGFPQINNVTWNINTENPDSNGETYNQWNWKSNLPEASCEAEQDWRTVTGAMTSFEYLKAGVCVVVPETDYKEAEKSTEVKACWEQVASCIVQGSWDAVYADSEADFEAVVTAMRSQAKAYGYEACISWCEQEAARRFTMEEAVRK